MTELDGRVAIVVGASSGIGYATAERFAHAGARVVVGARRRAELDRLVEKISGDGGHAVAVDGDVREEAYAHTLVAAAHEHYGGLDVAVNNVGTLGTMGPTAELSLEDWREVVDTNLTSAFLAAKHQIPALAARGGGSLIFTGTFVGYTVAFPGVAAYAASKSGLIGLTQALAVEVAQQGIRVNALLPGGTDTPMYREMGSTPEARDFIVGLYPMQRLATPEEIAHSMLYLASDASSFTTGSALLVDGGVSIYRN